MKKIEIIAVALFSIVSLVYRFQMPEESIESIELEVDITIYIEGKITEVLNYDEVPTIKDIFSDVGLTNIYHFDESYELHDKQVLYIPEESQTLVSLNKATTEELMLIPGIGPKTAENIITYRNTFEFKIIEDIMNISGIGEKTYYKIRGYLCL